MSILALANSSAVWLLNPCPERSLSILNDLSRVALLSGCRTRNTVLCPPDPIGSGLTFSQSLNVPIGSPLGNPISNYVHITVPPYNGFRRRVEYRFWETQ